MDLSNIDTQALKAELERRENKIKLLKWNTLKPNAAPVDGSDHLIDMNNENPLYLVTIHTGYDPMEYLVHSDESEEDIVESVQHYYLSHQWEGQQPTLEYIEDDGGGIIHIEIKEILRYTYADGYLKIFGNAANSNKKLETVVIPRTLLSDVIANFDAIHALGTESGENIKYWLNKVRNNYAGEDDDQAMFYMRKAQDIAKDLSMPYSEILSLLNKLKTF